MRMALTMSCASCSTSNQSIPIARLNGVRVLSQMRTALAASRGLTLLRKNSRSVPEAVHIKNAFDFKLINAESGRAGGGALVAPLPTLCQIR